jgi:hypothetical protein
MKEEFDKNRTVWLLLAVGGLFVFLDLDSMWSWSVDLAHHYALAFRISENWVLTSSNDPTLGEMNFYPRGGHVIAAILGWFLNSTFLGLQVATLVSLASIWLVAILILNSFKTPLAITSLVAFTGLLLFNSLLAKFELHGHEIIGNFFYAQLVGQAVLFIGMYFCMTLEKKLGAFFSIFALACIMLLNATIHLLPALEMLGLIFGLLALYVISTEKYDYNIVRRAVIAFPVMLFALLGLVLHPSFSAMKAISENNGELQLKNINYPYGLIFLCVSVLFGSLKLLVEWTKSRHELGNLALKYVSVYGAAVSALCLVQLLLTFFGFGSDYAVKKYEFGLASIFLIECSIIAGLYINRAAERRGIHFAGKDQYLNVSICIIALCSALFLNVPSQKLLDVSDIVSIERRLVALSYTLLPIPEGEKNNVALGLEGLPNTLDYMFSISIIKTPRELAIPDVLLKSNLTDLTKYSYIVSSSSNPHFGSSSCRSTSQGSISIVTSECVEQRMAVRSDCRSVFDFTSSGAIPSGLLTGFSSPETHGRWTDGSSARFECVNGGAPPKVLRLQLTPFLVGSLKSQRIVVTLNGERLGVYELSTARGVDNPITIDIPSSITANKFVLEFEIPDAKSPKEVGLSEDRRELGFSFQKISFASE